MILLYCTNGVVVSTHDDQLAPVAASVYGTGIRIIPYDQPLTTLDRVGTLPDPPPSQQPPARPVPDTRPYAQPTETPAILIDYAAQVRFEKSVADVSFTAASGVVPVHADRLSQMLLSNLALHCQSLAGTAAIDFTQDNIHYAVTAAETISMFNAVYAHIQACRTIEATCIADVNAGTTTVTAAAWDGSATTSYTTAAAHGYAVGDTVTISGSNPSTYDGTFTTVTGTAGSTIVVDMSTDPGAWVSGGALLMKTSTLLTYADVDAQFASV